MIGLTATCSKTALTRTKSDYPETTSSGDALVAERLIVQLLLFGLGMHAHPVVPT